MKNEIVEHSLLKSVILHLLPGLLVGACYFAMVPLVKANGFPSVMALSLAGIFILIPFESGFLLYQKRTTGQKLFNGVIQYLKPLSIRQYFVWVPVILISIGLVFKLLSFTSELIMPLFSWLPSDLFLNMGLNGEYSKSVLIITYAFLLFFVVLILPVIEEFYFRGYLLPRMPSRLKGWTEIVHGALFALYHTWTPWLFVTRAIGMLPLIYIVKRKENIVIGIISHCLLNSIDFIIGIIFILNM